MGKFSDAGLNFASVEPGAGTEPITNGWYWVKVERWEETETGPNAKNPGSLMYKLGVSVSEEGKHKGSWVWTQFVLDPKGKMIEQNIGTMKALMAACGIDEETMNDSEFDPDDAWGEENLIGKECDAYIVATPAKDGYEAGNNIRKFRVHEYTADDMLVS